MAAPLGDAAHPYLLKENVVFSHSPGASHQCRKIGAVHLVISPETHCGGVTGLVVQTILLDITYIRPALVQLDTIASNWTSKFAPAPVWSKSEGF